MTARPIDLSVVDPGLVAIEEGYVRWSALHAEYVRLCEAGFDVPIFSDEERVLNRARDDAQGAAWELRTKLLEMPARSPRSLLIKAALTVEAESLEGIEDACEQCDFDAYEVLTPVLNDLRAMVAGGVATA